MGTHTPGPWLAENGFTPGPWKLVDGGDTAIYDSRGESVIGRGAFPRRGHPEAWANLRLAAAAPDLLAELEKCREFLEDMHTQTVEWTVAESQVRHSAVCAAIAKATQP